MKNEILHVFRNTPFGKEAYLQSLYLSKTVGLQIKVFLPRYRQFLMYFPDRVVTVDLDKSFLAFPDSARKHATELAERYGVTVSVLEPSQYTASTLPDIPVEFGIMCCPRSIRDLSTKVGLGYIGPGVRSIIRNAPFPVLIPTAVYKEWKAIVVFFGGSRNAISALRLGFELQQASGLPLRLFTYVTGKSREHYVEAMREANLYGPVESGQVEWHFMENQPFKEALYAVRHDSLAVVGAYGHGVVKDILFGSTMEHVQTMLPNNLIVVGPNYRGLKT